MKVAFTSDLHVDITPMNQRLLPHLARRVAELNPDVLVLAGDIANTLASLGEALAAFSELTCLKIMVSGNHDVWVESNSQVQKGRDSFYKYREAIPEVCRRSGFVCPEESPLILGDAAVIGNIGWYDYTLRDPRLDAVYGIADYERGAFGNAVWNDARYAVWLAHPDAEDWRKRRIKLSNAAVFARHFEQLRSAVDLVPASVTKLLLVLHTAPFAACITPKPDPSPFDAFEGSTALGAYIEGVAAVGRQVAIICGHRHKPLVLERGTVQLYRSPVGYLGPADTDYEAIAQQVVGLFEV